MRKKLFKRIALFLLSIVFTLLTLELVSQIISPIKFQSFMGSSTKNWVCDEEFFSKSNFRPSRTLGYELVPNYPLGTNSLGMLDKERAEEKPKGIYRIICLGDSTTASTDYVRILEQLLNGGKKGGRFEVWNCGVPGYGVIQYCRALEEKWLRYDPDMVVIGFCLNDFHTTPVVVREHNRLVGYYPSKEIMPKVIPFLLKQSALYRFIIARLFLLKKLITFDFYDVVKSSHSYLRETKELLLAKETRFLIVIFGVTERIENSKWRRSYTEILKIIKDCDIDSVDIIPLFENNNPERLKKPGEEVEVHFNEQGSVIIAEAIFDYLNQSLKITERQN